MNWDAMGAIGETIGAIAVVATLAYLAVQIRMARTVASDTNRLTRATGVREFHLSASNNDSLLETMTTAYGADSYYGEYGDHFGISIKEAARLDSVHQYFFWLHWEPVFLH